MSSERRPHSPPRARVHRGASATKRATARAISVILAFGATFSVATAASAQADQITFTKKPSQYHFDGAGQVITYTYRIVNGPVGAVDISVIDSQIGPIWCPATTLLPHASMECVGQYTTTRRDAEGGSIGNSATLSLTEVTGTRVVRHATADIPYSGLVPSIAISKSGPFFFTLPGEILTYTYQLTNGPVGLVGVSVVDDFAGPVPCPSTVLTPGATMTCHVPYTVTDADVFRGVIVNTATVTATSTTGQRLAQAATATVPYGNNNRLALSKQASPSEFDGPGQVLTYHYRLSSGVSSLTDVSLVDSKIGPVTCPSTVLTPQQPLECTAQYTTTQADVLAGNLTNTVFAAGREVSTGLTISRRSQATVLYTGPQPGLRLLKISSPTLFTGPGNVITYGYRITSVSDQLTGVSLVDDRLGAIACPGTTLPPGGSMDCLARYTTTDADVAAGRIQNTATVTAVPPSGPPEIATADAEVVFVPVPGAVRLEKTAVPGTFSAAGQTVTYVYKITNPSTVALSGVSLLDNRLGAITCPATTLPPGTTMSCPAQYTTTAVDVAVGRIQNTAKVTANPPVGAPVVSTTVEEVAYRKPLPPLSLVKSATSGTFTGAGQPVVYVYRITNWSPTALSGISLVDSQLGPITCPATTLLPGTAMACPAQYTTTVADVAAGRIQNTASVTAFPPTGGPLISWSQAEVVFELTPGALSARTAI